ncbi:MAG: hypothetical protein WBI07_15225, partial [Mobilitalea sp.]
DDPYRVKMIAAHYLDNVEIFTETRGQVGLIGKFNNVPLTVLSTGIGKTSTMAYLTELCTKNQIKRVIYIGDCVTADSNLPIGSVMYIDKAYEDGKEYDASGNLLQSAELIMRENSIKANRCETTTDDHYLIDKKYSISQESKILDFTTAAIYGLKQIYSEIEILSILNVCENRSTNETIGEAVRQSGGHFAIQMALLTAIHKNN